MAEAPKPKLAHFEGPAVPLNNSARKSFAGLILDELEKQKDDTLFVQLPEKRKLTCGEVREKSISLGSALSNKLGVQKGEVGCVYAYNMPEALVSMYGCALSGMTIMLCDGRNPAPDLKWRLVESGCSFLFIPGTKDYLEKSLEAIKNTNVDKIVLISEAEDKAFVEKCNGGSAAVEIISLEHLCKEGKGKKAPEVAWEEDDAALIIYSSGTSGLPKGVVFPHGRILFLLTVVILNKMAIKKSGSQEIGRTFCASTIYHTYGFFVYALYSPYMCWQTFLLPGFDFHKILKVIQDEKITDLFLVPAAIIQLAKDPSVRDYNLRSIQYIVSSTAALPKEQIKAVYDVFGAENPPQILQLYAMTENSATSMMPGTPKEIILTGSVGQVSINHQVKIVDMDTLETVPINTEVRVLPSSIHWPPKLSGPP